MPLIKAQFSIAAGATVDLFDQPAAKQYQYMQADAGVRAGALARATGVVCNFLSGTDTLAKDSPVTVNATADSFPKDPDDLEWEDDVAAGDRMILEFRNTTAGAIVVAVVLKISWAG